MEEVELVEGVNLNLEDIVTPVDVVQLEQLLLEADYDKCETEYLIDGFKNGFSLGYQGPKEVKRFSQNLRLRVGNEAELWNKVMTKVVAGRFAGPF